MPWLISITSFVYIWITVIYAQILYECNFDTETITTNCLLPEGTSAMLVSERLGNAGNQTPTTPLSDVTSSLKPTDNGQPCNLPYKVNTTYTWDMYFCNNGFCPTSSNPNSTCTPGKFGHYNLSPTTRAATFRLNTDSGGTNRTGQLCLIYYYYLPKISGIQQNIIVRKEETGGSNDTIDTVTNSSFNGWIKRQVSFSTEKPVYRIYFDFERTSGLGLTGPIIAIDEISVRVGSCPGEPVTQSTTTIPIASTTKSSTIMTTMELTTIGTTFLSTSPTTTITTTTRNTTPTSLTTVTTAVTIPATTAPRTTHTTITAITPFRPSTTMVTNDSTSRPTTTNTSESSTIISTMELTTTMSTTTSNNSSIELSTLTSQKTSSGTSTTSSAFINPSTVPNNTYVIVLATVLPVILITTIGITICIKKCSSKKKISPSAFELNQRPPPPSQT